MSNFKDELSHSLHSVPLDEEFGKKDLMRRIPRPFAGWRKKIESWSEADKKHGTAVPLAYFCPLNHSCSHFTLLEINERNKGIYHYDSMADQGIIDGTKKSTRVRELVQVSWTSRSRGNLKTNQVRRSLAT